MAPSRVEWEPFLRPRGPIRVQRRDGTVVTYGDRGALQGIDGKTKVEDAADLELALSDGAGVPGRVIPGDRVISIHDSGPVIVIVVDDEIEPDSGATVITRGDQPPHGNPSSSG